MFEDKPSKRSRIQAEVDAIREEIAEENAQLLELLSDERTPESVREQFAYLLNAEIKPKPTQRPRLLCREMWLSA